MEARQLGETKLDLIGWEKYHISVPLIIVVVPTLHTWVDRLSSTVWSWTSL
jgi:hypothetical protein